MKANNPDRNVSNMDVLKDIRGLLSATTGREEPRVEDTGSSNSETAALIKKQQEEIARLKSENKELIAKLDSFVSCKDKPVGMAQIEAEKAEMTRALSQVEELVRLKSQELLRRIARIYQEAGQGEITLEFRKVGNGLEVTENFAHFVRALMGE